MQTNFETKSDPALQEAAQVLMDAAMVYWKEYQRIGLGGAVVWVKDTDGRMVILTRGEYQHTLMRNIDALERDDDLVRKFDLT